MSNINITKALNDTYIVEKNKVKIYIKTFMLNVKKLKKKQVVTKLFNNFENVFSQTNNILLLVKLNLLIEIKLKLTIYNIIGYV